MAPMKAPTTHANHPQKKRTEINVSYRSKGLSRGPTGDAAEQSGAGK